MSSDIHDFKPDDQHLLKYAAFNNSSAPVESDSGDSGTGNILSAPTTTPVETTLKSSEPTETAEQEADLPLNILSQKNPLWMLPLPKLLIAATLVGLILLIVFGVTQGMMSGTKVVTSTPPPSTAPASTPDPQTQNGTLQTEVMVGKQGSEIEKWNHPATTKRQASISKVSPGAKVAPATVAPAPIAPVYKRTTTRYNAPFTSGSDYTPPPVVSSYVRTLNERPPTSFTPTPKLAAPPPRECLDITGQPLTTSFSTGHTDTLNEGCPVMSRVFVTPTPDPQKEWNEAAAEGSFGSTSSGTRKDAVQVRAGITTSDVPFHNTGNGQLRTLTGTTAQLAQPAQITAQVQSGVQYQPQLNSSDPSKQLILGTQGEGRVDTTIRWSNSQSLQSQTLVIKVTQALESADSKSAVIPQGSYLTAQILNTDTNGFLSLSVVSVNLNINGQLQLSPTPLPSNAIQVLNKKGDSLQAKFHGPKTGSSFLSMLSNAASSTGIGSNNLGLSALNTLTARQNFPFQNVYFSLEQGTPVRLYVKQSFSL